MGGAASSWMLDVLGKKMMDRDFKPAFAIKHQQKDLAIVLERPRAEGRPAARHRARPPAALGARGAGAGRGRHAGAPDPLRAHDRARMTRPLAGVRALLVDLEGTVYQSERLIPGAAEALREAEARGVTHRFVTNTTSRPRAVIARQLADMGFAVDPERIFTAPRAARARLLRRGRAAVRLSREPGAAGRLRGSRLRRGSLPKPSSSATWARASRTRGSTAPCAT